MFKAIALYRSDTTITLTALPNKFLRDSGGFFKKIFKSIFIAIFKGKTARKRGKLIQSGYTVNSYVVVHILPKHQKPAPGATTPCLHESQLPEAIPSNGWYL